jgi:hypothetical protein
MPASSLPNLNAQNQQAEKQKQKKPGFFEKLKSIFR